MKISCEWQGEWLVVVYRVYYRRESSFISYMARIAGPDPNFIIRRIFLPNYGGQRRRYVQFRYKICRDGIYELAVVRRIDEKRRTRERHWLVVFNGKHYWYDGDDMNYQYVLYCESLPHPQQA